MIYVFASICVAYIMDRVIGDVPWLPQPVHAIERFVAFMERHLLHAQASPSSQRICGAIMVVIVAFFVVLIPTLVIFLLYFLMPGLDWVLHTFFCYQLLSAKTTRNECMLVHDLLKKGDLEGARKALTLMTGRDATGLSQEEIVKITLETVARQTTNGVVAPFFFMCFGGAPLALFYKSVNVMDGKVGYLNDKYRYFGTVAARLDDLLKLIPARFCGIFLVYSAYLLRLDWKNAWKIFRRDRNKPAGPNAGMSLAAAAGALHVRLGGDYYENGQLIQCAAVGDAEKPLEFSLISQMKDLMLASSICAWLFFLVVAWYIFM